MENSDKKINLSNIEEIEKKLNIILPKSYKEFLLVTNGGTPDKDTFICGETQGYNYINKEDKIDMVGVSYFLRLEELSTVNIDIPEGMLVIGEDSAGNSICLSTLCKDYGYIYFADHNYGSESDDYYSSLYFLSTDFGLFFKSLNSNTSISNRDFESLCMKGNIKKIFKYLNEVSDYSLMLDSGMTLIQVASQNNLKDIVVFLIDNGANIDGAMNYTYSIEIMNLLLSHGYDIEKKDKNGRTALINASFSGSPHKVKFLLEKGADINAIDNNGNNAIDYSVNKFAENYKEVYQLLSNKIS